MNQKQLNNLKDFVEKRFPDKLIDYAYYSSTYNCNCIIGAMLVDVGGEKEDKYVDNTGIPDFFYAFAASKDAYHKSLHKMFIQRFGMENDEINGLQDVNDKFTPSSSDPKIGIKERAEHVKKWLLNYIAEKEGELT